MQYPFSLTPKTLASIEATLSSQRFARYIREAKGDRNFALRLYVWNVRLCEAFYLPMQFAEVAARNAIHLPIRKRFGKEWFDNGSFKGLLRPAVLAEIDRVVADQRAKQKSDFGPDHVIAGLSLGVWLNFMTQSYVNHLWGNGLHRSFPNLPKAMDLVALYKKLDKLRSFRNRVAHHEAIFHRRPRAELQNLMNVIGWIDSDTQWLAHKLSQVEQVLSRKPTI
jgi:hypothetical protein